MPWPLANRPSIQLGTLKSYIKSKAPDITVDCYHLYLDVANLLGLKTYNDISKRTWSAESVYGYLLNPGKRHEILNLFHQKYGSKKRGDAHSLKTISSQIHRLHQRQNRNVDWSSYNLIGFSICLSQLTSSIYMIKQIRKNHPNSTLVVGGSGCAADLGKSLLTHVSEIDFAVSGEGELPLLELINRIRDGNVAGGDSPGLLWRDETGRITGGEVKQLPDLNDLLVPDYSDYFKEISKQPRLSNLVPNIPVETSRGCWWHRYSSSSVDRACRFCNLNLQWRGYRSKEPVQVAREMDWLAEKHASLKFSFADNILDNKKLNRLFLSVKEQNRDFEIFTELRASVSRDNLVQMRQAGVTQVQIGIEALSTRLLRKINKGTTAIQNIQILKHCQELGIQHSSNLILGFPTSDAEDVEETLTSLKFVSPYQPLRTVRFWLGQNSPIYFHPERYGIRRIANHPYYHRLLPDSLADSLCLMIKTYVGDRTKQRKLWLPVAREVARWQRQYRSLRQQHFPASLLSYRDGGNFLLIRRRAEGSEMETFRLRGSSRAIYKFCGTIRTLTQLQREFPNFTSDRLLNFVAVMVAKKLMFQEGKQVLSLAVNEELHKVLCDPGK